MELQNYFQELVVKRIKKSKDFHIIAKSCFENENFNQALEYYTQALNLNPTNSDIYCERAECFYGLKNKKHFIRDLTFAITVNNGKERKYWEKRVDGYYRIGEKKLGDRDIEIIKKLFNIKNIDELNLNLSKYQSNNSLESVLSEKSANTAELDWNSMGGDSDNMMQRLKRVFDSHDDSQTEEDLSELYKLNKLNISKFKFIIIQLFNTKFNEIYRVYNDKFDEINETRFPAFEKLIDEGLDTIESPELLLYYIQKLGKTNTARFLEASKKILHLIEGKELEVYDWGSGYSFYTSLFSEYVRTANTRATATNFTLIDPSILTIYLQNIHLKLINRNCSVKLHIKPLSQINPKEFKSLNKTCKVHFLSNIFSDEKFDWNGFTEAINNLKGMNIFICIESNKNYFENVNKFYNEGMEIFKKEMVANNEKDIQFQKWQGVKLSNLISSNLSDNYFSFKNDPWIRKEVIFYTNVR